jgi:hypothetical protein
MFLRSAIAPSLGLEDTGTRRRMGLRGGLGPRERTVAYRSRRRQKGTRRQRIRQKERAEA